MNQNAAFLESALLISGMGAGDTGGGRSSNWHGLPEFDPDSVNPKSQPLKSSNEGGSASFCVGGWEAITVWIACDIAYW